MIPKELKRAVSSLNHKTRWTIIENLEQSEFSYTELLNITNVKKGSLTHHLTKLMESGLVDNFSQGQFNEPYSSYYRLSDFGKDFLSALFSSVEVIVPISASESDEKDNFVKSIRPSDIAVYDESQSPLRVFETRNTSTSRPKRARYYLPKKETKPKVSHALFAK